MFGASLHRFVVYLPLGLAIAALLYDLRGAFSAAPRFHVIGSRLVRWTTLTAAAAVATGFSLAGTAGLGSGGAVAGHAGVALAGTLVFGVLSFLRYSAENREGDPADVAFRKEWIALECIAVALVAAAAVMGFRS